MLDHEPDANTTPSPSDGTTHPSNETSTSNDTPAAAPRRRRAATRKAGPPAVAEDRSAGPVEDGPASVSAPAASPEPVMTAEATPAADPGPSSEPATVSEAPTAAEPPAKKTARKRTTKAAKSGSTESASSSGSRPARKRASKKVVEPAPVETRADGSAPDQAPDQGQAPVAGPAGGPGPDADASGVGGPDASSPAAEAALDEIRTALSAELASPAPQDVDGGAAGQSDVAADAASVADGSPAGVAAEADAAEDQSAEDESADEAAADEPDDGDTDDSDTDDSDTDDGDTDTDEGDTDEADTDESGSPRRRRRRRGGRRRRRGGSDADETRDESTRREGESAPEDQSADERTGPDPADEADGRRKGSDAPGADDDASEESGSDDGSGEDGGQRRRRRRRRRRGEESGPAADDPVEVVVRVREPRSRKQAAQEVTGIEGSTRMEAKRQRRREGREAGRRRAPILSEAEFLARRESVTRKMIIRQREELSQIAVLEDDILVEHYVDRESAATLIGNVYLGRVQNVLPSMEAAFIDIGRGRNAVLYAGEVDWDAFGANGQQRKVENVLKSGQTVLVQVTKDPVGAKGARLTSHITLPGRYIVYAPGGHLSGISRKLPDNERKRLKSVLNDLVPESASVIVRTAAEGASEDELVRDVNRLKAQWEDIERKVKQGSAPKLLYGEPDLTVRIVRDLFTEDFAELIIQGNGSQADAYEAVDGYVSHVAPHLHDRLRRWDAAADGDLFAKFRLDEQIAKALERKVFLPSGGSLIIDRTEAMTVIDVNTGKFTGSGGNLEATVTSNNLEAAEEIVRQLRLRDIGGIIVIDFIDMVLPSNRELLLRRLVECLGRDRTRHQVAEVTSLGLVQMTRKKIGTGLLEAFTSECEHCHGRGYEIFDMPVETQKQPDGGSRDQRGGGRDRGRGRGNQSGSAGNGKQHPVPTPPQHRPDPVPEQQPDPAVTAADGAAEPVADVSPESSAASGRAAAESAPETTTDNAAAEGVPAS